MNRYSERLGIGRPKGHRLSKKSRNKIKESRLGTTHTTETKQKISEGVRKIHKCGAPIEILINTDLSKCGTVSTKNGYVSVIIPNPVCGEPSFQQRLHVAMVEKSIGRKLTKGEQVHHWGSRSSNFIDILTLCRDKQHHMLLDKAKKNLYKTLFNLI